MTVPYNAFYIALQTYKQPVGRCARRRVSEARLTGNARQFAKQTRSCSCKTHWVLHCSPSHFRKLKYDLLARNLATAVRWLLGRRWMPSSRRGEPLLVMAKRCKPFVGDDACIVPLAFATLQTIKICAIPCPPVGRGHPTTPRMSFALYAFVLGSARRATPHRLSPELPSEESQSRI